ncbi:putative phage repressor [Cupriavidus oxalaticus]|uniref:Phage repressor n=2 Tax=Cupriavidus oxalaticus TaxID=96344 RepID=A0A976BFR3_9BURK|nr:LexA family transcriptional regulator [Cupriavidus oxalaticus]SPC17363.1 putative phage repressor [Cupriavidus oxalaticus]
MLTGEKLGAAIEQARQEKGVSKKALADAMGVKPASVQDWVKYGRIAKERINDLVAYFSDVVGPEHWGLDFAPTVNPKFGADQKKTKLNEKSETDAYNPPPTAAKTLHGVYVRPIVTYESLEELPQESTVLVTRIDVELSAGNGKETWHIEEKEPLPFQADYIRRLDAKPKNLVAVKVTGDSMEPRLFDDDSVIVDRADTRVPANGGVFALVYAGEMLVKRLFQLPGGILKIVSDNHERYEPIILQPDQVEHISVVGRVKYRSGMGDF